MCYDDYVFFCVIRVSLLIIMIQSLGRSLITNILLKKMTQHGLVSSRLSVHIVMASLVTLRFVFTMLE